MILKGLKVLDLSTVLAGPSVASFLGELGADILKIEHPENRDVTRSWKLPSEDASSNISAYFASVNYGKNYFELDLKNENDYKILQHHIAVSDIVIMNFKSVDYEKLKITDEALLSINEKLIIAKIVGFSDTSDRVAYDLILQAETGFMSMNGTVDSGPVKMPVAMIDVLAAHQLKEAILLALFERKGNNEFKGRSISASLYDAAVSSLVNQASNYLMTGTIAKRIGSLHPNIAPYGEIFTTKDNGLITLAVGSNIHFEKLCVFLGLENLCADPGFSDNQNRVINRKALFIELENVIKNYKTEELIDGLNDLKVPIGEIKNLNQVFSENSVKDLIISENIEGVETKRVKQVVWKEK